MATASHGLIPGPGRFWLRDHEHAGLPPVTRSASCRRRPGPARAGPRPTGTAPRVGSAGAVGRCRGAGRAGPRGGRAAVGGPSPESVVRRCNMPAWRCCRVKCRRCRYTSVGGRAAYRQRASGPRPRDAAGGRCAGVHLVEAWLWNTRTVGSDEHCFRPVHRTPRSRSAAVRNPNAGRTDRCPEALLGGASCCSSGTRRSPAGAGTPGAAGRRWRRRPRRTMRRSRPRAAAGDPRSGWGRSRRRRPRRAGARPTTRRWRGCGPSTGRARPARAPGCRGPGQVGEVVARVDRASGLATITWRAVSACSASPPNSNRYE